MKILICGMPRSMTTWVFNVVRELLAAGKVQTMWIAPSDAGGEMSFVSTGETVLAKCHHYSQALADAADCVIYTYRDLRTAAISYARKFGAECSVGVLDAWVRAGDEWETRGAVSLRYEHLQEAPLAAVTHLRKVLAGRLGVQAVTSGTDETVLARVEALFAERQEAGSEGYDPETMILPQHRTFQPGVADLNETETALYNRVGQDFAVWLSEHGYLLQESLGQALDYRLCAGVLHKLTEPRVIDVGVERGSFTEMALQAGASRVICFEALPRHVAHLAARFADEPRVQLHAKAVSDHSGHGAFHVALDNEGRELDYHHTLADLGDSTTVVRSAKVIDVETVALGELVAEGALPADIDFLKVDTDGHDLFVLKGLGSVRPRFILAEFWDTLPDSSGRNPYRLADLANWAQDQDYAGNIVVRRHGHLESVERDAPWTQPGDWGNVLFVRDAADLSLIRPVVDTLAASAQRGRRGYVERLVQDCEEKEAEIRRLDNALTAIRKGHRATGGNLEAELRAKEAVIQELSAALDAARVQMEDKERLIGSLHSEGGMLNKALSERDVVFHDLSRTHHDLVGRLGNHDSILAEQRKELNDIRQEIKCLTEAMDSKGTRAASAAVVEGLRRELAEKESVISELAGAVEAYRKASLRAMPGHLLYKYWLVLKATTKALCSPRLGNLNQYSPRTVVLPAHYYRKIELCEMPRVAIVTPSYNQADYIGRTIDSVLDQGYDNLQYFVQDGGSKDNTVDVLSAYADRIAGWDSRRDEGQSQAINLGFSKVDGDIMAWLNSDDLLLPGALRYVVDYFNKHPDVDVVYGNRILVDQNDQEIGQWILPGHDGKALQWADFVPQETLFWRRRIWEKIGGGIDESFRFAMDWDLLLRFQKANARFAHLPRFLGAFRIHEHQKTSAVINEIGMQEMDRLRQRELGFVPDYPTIRRALAFFALRHLVTDLGYRVRVALGLKMHQWGPR